MIDYTSKAPGVYVEEITPAGPIAGAGTTTTALIGTVTATIADAALGQPVAVTSWTAFVSGFGGFTAGLDLPYAVAGFFQNGGTLAYIVPIKDVSGLPAALDALTRQPDVRIVCAPGLIDPAAQSTVIGHCESMADRFAVLDGAPDQTPLEATGALQTQRSGLSSDNGYAALYWPPIGVVDQTNGAAAGAVVSVGPSGHVAGLMARVDGSIGVHRAPANEQLIGAVSLGYVLNSTEQGVLNHLNINTIRTFAGTPPMVWGARTLTSGTVWQYVNVRRLVTYLEQSIQTGVRWAVFAPNTPALWKGLERTITEFLNRVWQSGALFGQTAKDAFYVRIDAELNPPDVVALGQVIAEIGLAPTSPAEFVILRFGLWDGANPISEG